jgi:cytochrome P450
MYMSTQQATQAQQATIPLRSRRTRHDASPPGPRLPRHLLGAWWLLDEPSLLERCRRRYGDVFTLNCWPFDDRLVAICDPAEIKRVFTADSNVVRAGEGNTFLEDVTGPESVLLLDGDRHLHRRKLMLPSFHGERIGAYGELMRQITDAEIDRWPVGRAFPSHTSMQSITLQVILRAVFGIENAARMSELERLIPGLLGSIVLVMPQLQRDLWPGSPWRRFTATRDAVDAILFDEMARKRADPNLAERSDVLSMLLEATDEDGEHMTDAELRDQLVTLLLAGHETTATALAWTFERLTRNPQVLARLRATLAENDEDYLECVIKESLRSRPVVSYAMRRTTEPFSVGGYTAPAGAYLGTSVVLTHKNPKLYPDPQLFRPERFADKRTDTYAWVPFGGGTRRCLGAAFATYEMKVVLRRVVERCELTTPEQKPERAKRRFVTFVPNRGARVVLEKRTALSGSAHR